jgi:hypothetical protein
MNLKMIEETYLGSNMVIVTRSGNKIKGEIIKSDGEGDMLKLKTEDGVIIVSTNAIESIY